jgi:predicted RNase H-like HicB family nuclease
MGTTKYTIKITKDEDGSLYAEVIELPWCFTTGENIDELKKNIKEAIECYLEWMKLDIEKNAVSYDYLQAYA